jgi:hypothetical protein
MEKKDLSNKPLEVILNECAIITMIPLLQHRVIYHFGDFVRQCMDIDNELYERFKNRKKDLGSPNPDVLQKWGLLYYEYCLEEYGD